MYLNSKKQLENKIIKTTERMKLHALEMAFNAGKNGAHLGSAFSCMEIMAVLYGYVLKYDIGNPIWDERDRFIASKAHCVLAYYTALQEAGFLLDQDLNTFEKNGTFLAGHPVLDYEKGIEYSGGSLGMALSVGVGMAIAAKQDKKQYRSFILLGDGELNEGSNWEAFLAGAHFKLDNLVAIIDKNGLQNDGDTEEIMGLGNLEAKLVAFDWEVIQVNGHDISQLIEVFDSITKIKNKPVAIIARTVKGNGISFMKNVKEWHHGVLSQKQYERAILDIREGSHNARI